MALFMLVAANKTLTTWANVNLFKSAVVCVAIAVMCGCDQGQPTAPVPLPESATSIGMEFKLIPAGTFIMGEGDQAHEVTLTKPFWMGVHEVTQAQYEQVMGVNPSKYKGADNPVETVSWEDAVEFCRKLSELPAEKEAGNVYRLPTEAEWEYACRAGTNTKYSFGNDESDLSGHGWYDQAANGDKHHPVGSKQPNAWGLYDMHGNVWEWCQDWKEDYPEGAVTDPSGPTLTMMQVSPSGPWYRVIRGGSWVNTAEYCRSATRFGGNLSYSVNGLGFRVSLSPSGKPVAMNVEDMELPESVDSIGMEFKLIPAGTFIMGDDLGLYATEDRAFVTPHEVILTTSFKMGVHEVTQAQYEQVMGVNPSEFKGANNPVETVSWDDAVEFCNRLSNLPAEKAAGNVYRLPTEAEWEYACRAGTTTMYSFGDDESELKQYGWFFDNPDSKTHPVGSKQPNAWGLYDMHGNVEEWCQDRCGDYPRGSVTDPSGGTSGSVRMIRGGSWCRTAKGCRSAKRYGSRPSARYYGSGFRVVLSSHGK
ncbi:formylglycine-generating enzyme family protein [bacterium]|nr:formylglycine-generating enzyme family protein [bacterium]